MATLPLDLTGSLTTNLIRGEQKTITREADRYFVPANGAFYGDLHFRIYNNANGALLEPNTQYRLLHLVEEAVKASYKNVYAVIHIVDKNISTVRYEYQAVGGVYQNIASVIDQHLSEYLLGSTGSNAIGSVVGVPHQVAPEHHLQALGDFQGAGALLAMLEKIRQGVVLGNAPAFAAAYEYINERYSDAIVQLTARVASAVSQVEEMEQRTQIQNGDYHITSNPANPSTYLGYGNWILDTNMLLFGSGTGDDIGEFVDVGVGEDGHVAIRRYFWRRDDEATGATYQLSSNMSSVNEGGTVRVTLTTSGLAAGTKVAYKITGVTASDLVNTPLNGEFTMGSTNMAYIDIPVRQDMATEGVEVMRVSLSAMPNVYTDITVNDTSLAPSYSIRFSGSSNGSGEVSSVNEGSTVYAVINTIGVAAGTKLYVLYNDSTVSTDDILNNVFNDGYIVTLNDLGSAILPIEIKADALTEGNETLVLNICTTNNINSRVVRGVITVNDTSKSPVSNLRFSTNSAGTSLINTANEGTTFYAVISVENIPDSASLDIVYGGTANAADFTTALPSSVSVNGSQAIIPFSLRNDVATEGDESFIVSVYYGGTKLSESTLIVKDTSLNPTYDVRFSSNTNGTDRISSVNEGSTAYLTIKTTNITNGKVYTVEYSGTANASDISGTRPTSLTINNNAASAALIIRADATTESAETLIATIKDGTTVIGTASITINDTSVSPTATIRYSSNSSGTNTITRINEGQTAYAIIETTNVANGTILPVTHGGSAVAADFANARVSSVTVQSNRAVVELRLANDLRSEGEESYTVAVKLPNNTTVTSGALSIIDTSVPTFNAYFSGSSTGVGQITSINEGQTAYLVLETTGVSTNSTVNAAITYTGTTTAADLAAGAMKASVPITGARTIIPYAFLNDANADGNKTMTVAISIPVTGIANRTATININDTSKFNTLTATGDIVIPPGKSARVFVLSIPPSSGGTTSGTVGVTIDGTSYNVLPGGRGSDVTYLEQGYLYIRPGLNQPYKGLIYTNEQLQKTAARNGYTFRSGSVNAHVNDPDAATIAAGGLVQLVYVTPFSTNSTRILPFTNVGTIGTHVLSLMKNVTGPLKYDPEGDSAQPGTADTNSLMAFTYVNTGTTEKRLRFYINNYSASGTVGSPPQCIYEIHNTYTSARLGYRKTDTHTWDGDDSYTRTVTLKANKTYHIGVVSGAGVTYNPANAADVVNARGQSVNVTFSHTSTSLYLPPGANKATNDFSSTGNEFMLNSGVAGMSGFETQNTKTFVQTNDVLNNGPLMTTHIRIFPSVPPIGTDPDRVFAAGHCSLYRGGGVNGAHAGNAMAFTFKHTQDVTMNVRFSSLYYGGDSAAGAGGEDSGAGAALYITELT